MSAIGAKQRLMGEYKELEKEKWVNVEVSHSFRTPLCPVHANMSSARRASSLQMEHRPHGYQFGQRLRWCLLQGEFAIPRPDTFTNPSLRPI